MSHPTDTIRAWKDPAFRDTLCETSRAALPAHPAGEIDALNDRGELVTGGASTEYLLTLGCCQGLTSNCGGATVQAPGMLCTVACITIWWTTKAICKPT